MPELAIDELVWPAWFREHVLNNGSIHVFQTYPRHPPAHLDTFRAPYIPWISELEDEWYPTEDARLMPQMAAGGFTIKLAMVTAVVYIILISALQRWMENRERAHLRGVLIVWNSALCIFSILGTLRSAPEFFDIIRQEGVAGSLCNARTRHTGAEMWGWFFVVSKIAEMGDTVWIVLRKQKLIFLHWYHHVATMMYTWTFTVLDSSAPGRWFMLMNYAVHSVMYGYYATRASRLVTIPRQVNMAITTAQIAQMLVGYVVAIGAWYLKASGVHCEVTMVNLTVCNTMYLTYILLFSNYFYHVYIRKPIAGEGKPIAGEGKPIAGEGKSITGEGKPTSDEAAGLPQTSSGKKEAADTFSDHVAADERGDIRRLEKKVQ